MEQGRQRFSWASLPLIATVARLLCRELMLQVEYHQLENQVLRSKITGTIRFTEDERGSLVVAAMATSHLSTGPPAPSASSRPAASTPSTSTTCAGGRS